MDDKHVVTLERVVEMRAAFDKRHTDPSKNYGVHGVDLLMYVRGDKGATQFLLYTNWQLPHVAESQNAMRSDHLLCRPTPADLGYHAKEPRYEGQTKRDDCHITGGVCYYDSSGLNAERIFEVLLREGSEGVWKELEEYYHELFDER